MKKFGIAVVFFFVLGYLGYLGWKIYSTLGQEASDDSDSAVQQPKRPIPAAQPEEEKVVVASEENTFRTNPEYRESAETQVKWMERGQQIALQRFAGANRAEFKNTYYHRGFTYKPVACGEIQAWRDEKLVADFQRFIYVGTTLAYFESKVENFDIYWKRMCVETMENPRP